MSIKTKIKVSGLELEVQGENEMDIIRQISFFSSLPNKCENCGSDEALGFEYRKTGEYEFYSRPCGKCKHELKFGIRKDGTGLFPKGTEPPYSGGGGGGDDPSGSTNAKGGWD